MAEDLIMYPGPKALERDAVDLYVQFTQGAGGAVSTYTRQRGVSGVSWTATGKLRVTLLKPYAALLDARVLFKVGATGKGYQFELNTEDVDGSTSYVDLLIMNGASPPVLVSPASIDIIVILTVQDSKV